MMSDLLEKDKGENGVEFLRLIACPHPLSVEQGRIDRMVPEGATVREHLLAIGLDPDPLFAEVWIDERPILKAQWEWTVPRAGQNLTVRAIPLGGGGGEAGKTAVRIVAMLAIIAAAAYTGGAAASLFGFTAGTTGFAITSAVVSTAVTITGTLAVTALIPPSRQLDDGFGAGAANPSFRITGTQNQLLPFGMVPQVLGRHRLFPVYAARPFTEVVGDQVFFRALFTLGLGPLSLSDFKIGETALAQFQDVEMEIRYGYSDDAPLTLFPDDVFEDNISILLTNAAGFQLRTSQPRARELSVDCTFPEGLGSRNLDAGGRIEVSTVSLTVEYRKVGDAGWTVVNDIPGVAATVTTTFSGANNDLTFTASAIGYAGNQIGIFLQSGATLSATPDERAYIFTVTLIDGVTTAAQVKAALDAVIGAAITIANAPGNDGTGAITLGAEWVFLQLSGGRDYQPSLVVSNNVWSPFTVNLRWLVATPDEQYEVRVKRVTGDTSDPLVHHNVYWTTLRTIQTLPPTTLAGQCLIALRIRSTNQLNGQLDEFNCVAQTICPDWTGTEWLTRPTNNPGSLYRYVLQGPANAKPKPDSRLDLTTIQTFADRCRTNGFAFNAVIDSRTTVRQLRQDVLAAGRGSFGLRDLLYSVVEDLIQSIPVQTVTPRNAWDLKGTKLFVDLPHARKVRFKNEAKGWQDDERIVPLDGYGVTGLDNVRRDAWGNSTANPEATKFETIDAGVGVTDAVQVFTLERYNQAVAVLRSEHWEVSQDIEYLRCTRGDRVDVNYDVLLVGLGSARVKAVAVDGGGNATGCTLDEPLVMEAGKIYGAKFRRSDGAQTAGTFVTVAGMQTVFTFATAIPSANKPAIMDLAALGEYGQETLACLVRGIRAGRDFSATLTLVPYAPGVQTAAMGNIPPFESGITIPAAVSPTPMPLIKAVQSDETVLVQAVDGSLESRILMTLALASGFTVPAMELQVRLRETGSLLPWRQLSFPPDSTQLSVTDVQDGVSYDLALRTIGAEGRTSDWVSINHTVIGKTSPPPDVTNLNINTGQLFWTYPVVPLDFAGFRVRVQVGDRRSWDNAISLHDGLLSGPSFVLFADSGMRTYLVKGEDTSGNQSAAAATLLVDWGQIPAQNVAEIIDLKAMGFPGTITNGTVAGGNLTADTDSVFWTNDDQPIWTLDADPIWTGTYKQLTYVAIVTPPSEWLGGRLFVDLTVAGEGYQLDYRPDFIQPFWTVDSEPVWTGDSNPAWTGSSGDYLPWPGSFDGYTRQVYEFRVRVNSSQTQGIVSKYQLVFDMPDLTEVVQNVALATGGTRIPLTKIYRAIKAVIPSLVEDGGSARRVKVLDLDTAGPMLAAVDNLDTDTTGQAHVLVQGY